MKSSKQATRVKPYIGKLEGYVSVISPLELNALITGESLTVKRFNQGDRVRYVGSNKHLRAAYKERELQVNQVLPSDPRWVCCIYSWQRLCFGGLELRRDFTPWIKGEDLQLIQ